jgi:hypothetical protein
METPTVSSRAGWGVVGMDAQRPGLTKIRELKEGVEVRGFFAVRWKELPRSYKNKAGQWFMLRIGDSTGDMPLKYWGGEDEGRTAKVYGSFSMGSVIYVQGMAAFDRYEDGLVVVVNEGKDELRVVEEGVERLDLVPSLAQDRIQVLTEELFELIASVPSWSRSSTHPPPSVTTMPTWVATWSTPSTWRGSWTWWQPGTLGWTGTWSSPGRSCMTWASSGSTASPPRWR